MKLFSLSLIILLSICFVSAGFLDNIFNPSGKASSDTQDVSVSVAGTHIPSIDEPSASIAAVTPSENNTVAVDFTVVVTDLDGVANIVDSTLLAQVSRGATMRTATCINPTDIDADSRSYDCSIDMNYYDEAGNWDLYVEVEDQETKVGSVNLLAYFTYNLLAAMEVPLSPSNLIWDTLTPGAINQNSTNDPTVVTNMGNYAGTITLTAYDLEGETTAGEFIPASDFSVGSTTGGATPAECDVGVTAVALGGDGNPVDTLINANPGPVGVANIYYCITSVPFVSSQVYSTSTRGPAYAWVVSYG